MPDWLLIIVGCVAGLAGIYGILWACFRLESRRSKRNLWLAEPSGRWDSPSLPGGD